MEQEESTKRHRSDFHMTKSQEEIYRYFKRNRKFTYTDILNHGLRTLERESDLAKLEIQGTGVLKAQCHHKTFKGKSGDVLFFSKFQVKFNHRTKNTIEILIHEVEQLTTNRFRITYTLFKTKVTEQLVVQRHRISEEILDIFGAVKLKNQQIEKEEANVEIKEHEKSIKSAGNHTYRKRARPN